jgi:hypothetical protein
MPASNASLRKRRAENDFKIASQRLLTKIPDSTCAQLKKVVLPNFDSLPNVEAKVGGLEKSIETFLLSREEFIESRDRLQVITDTMSELYRASYPFLTLILGVTKEAAQVHLRTRPKMLMIRCPVWVRLE